MKRYRPTPRTCKAISLRGVTRGCTLHSENSCSSSVCSWFVSSWPTCPVAAPPPSLAPRPPSSEDEVGSSEAPSVEPCSPRPSSIPLGFSSVSELSSAGGLSLGCAEGGQGHTKRGKGCPLNWVESLKSTFSTIRLTLACEYF